jgi:DNA-binding LacI/PurR family transcriptional regulator
MSGIRLSDLATSLGLNIATVSRGLRDDPRIKPETRERIRAEAERLGYRPNVAARALAEGRTRTVWFVLPDLEDAVAREPAWHASRFLLEKGYDLLLAQHHNDEAVFRRILDRLARGGADAAIIIPDVSTEGTADATLGRARVPFVYLDRRLEGLWNATVVTTDNQRAASGLVEALAALGPEGPADLVVNAFGIPNRNSVETLRRAGVDEAARRLGLPVIDGSAALPPCRHPLVLASAEATCLEILKRFEAPVSAGVGVFDHWRTGPRPGARILVAVQDFQTMARVAVERLFAQLRGDEGQTRRDDLIPLAKTWEVR